MRKRILAMLLCLCMVLCMIPLTASAAEAETPKVYVALGDSIPAGVGLGEDETAFPELLAEKCGYTLENLSESGATSADLANTVKDNLTKVASADIITITVGGNDLMKALYTYVAAQYNEGKETEAQLTPEAIQDQLENGNSTVLMAVLPYLTAFTKSDEVKQVLETFSNTMIETIAGIKAVNTDAAIVLTNQYNPYAYLAKELAGTDYADAATILSTGFEAGITALNQVIDTVATLTQCSVVTDVYSVFAVAAENPCNAGFTTETTYTLDFHPNAYGHSLIAQALDETLNPLPFTDVEKDQWYYQAVRYAYFNDLMAGTGNNKFEPITVLDRATVVQLLYNLEGQPEVKELTDKFTDVGSQWYATAISWAVENNVVAGYEDETFRPETPVSREAFAQMLYNYAKFKKYDVETDADLKAFTDVDKVSDWALTALTWANANKLINGNGDGTINPAGGAQRAHAASILMNFCENVAAK